MTRFAGEKVDVSAYLGNGPDFSALGNMGQEANSYMKKAGYNAAAEVASAGISSMGTVMGSKFGADATRAQGEAAASGIEAKGMSSMISSIAGGIGGLNFGGGSSNTTVTGNKLPSFTRRDTSTNMITTY